MIFFLNVRRNRHPIDKYLNSRWGRRLLTVIYPLTYQDIAAKKQLPAGTYIFTDFEMLGREKCSNLLPLYEKLTAQPETRVLNHPQKTLRRYDLLKGLYEKKINTFNVYYPDEDLSGITFPVFIRLENDHRGTRSDLIHDRDTLESKIKELDKEYARVKAAGLLICEFCDTSDEDGVFRKYSAFIVDGVIIPRHLFFSRHWMIKFDDLYNEQYFQEEMSYVADNPHEQELRSLFKEADITFGRIDYSFLNGKIQIWEINTNPMIISSKTDLKPPRGQVHSTFAAAIKQSFLDLDQGSTTPPIVRYGYAIRTCWRFFFTFLFPGWEEFKSQLADKAPWLLQFYQSRHTLSSRSSKS